MGVPAAVLPFGLCGVSLSRHLDQTGEAQIIMAGNVPPVPPPLVAKKLQERDLNVLIKIPGRLRMRTNPSATMSGRDFMALAEFS